MRKLASIVIAVAFLAALSLADGPKSQTIAGYITDAKCAAKGGSPSNADCAKKCIEKGEKAVLVTDSDKKVLTIDNQDAVKDHAGHHVSVTGTVTGDTLHVDKVAMVEEPPAK